MPDDVTHRWAPDRHAALETAAGETPPLSLPVALGRGLLGRCPACGQSPIFRRFLKVVPACAHCGAPLGVVRADDAPPYFVIVITAHIVVSGMLLMQRAYDPPSWLQAAIWLPATLVLALALLQPVKGATVGLMMKLGMMKDGDGDPGATPEGRP